jgi:hypothetical protein
MNHHSRMRSVWLVIVLLLVLAVVSGEVVWRRVARTHSEIVTLPSASDIDAPAAPSEIGHVTAANIARIHNGMTREQVDTLLGADHVLARGGTLVHRDILYAEPTEGQLGTHVWVLFESNTGVIGIATEEAPRTNKKTP